jgi:hypothetical protein
MRFEPGLEIEIIRTYEPGYSESEAITYESKEGLRTQDYELIAEGFSHGDSVVGYDFDGHKVWTEKVKVNPT